MVAAMTAPKTTAGATAGTKPTVRHPAPPELADVAMIDAPRIAAAGCMSLSTWHDLVRRGEAPQPVIRAPRCTRWKLSDIRKWLTERAERGSDPHQAHAVVNKARRASKASAAKRATVEA